MRAQGYTQFGGLRPFGVSFLFAGWDAVHGFQLYQSDPSGNYGGWKATCIGARPATRVRGRSAACAPDRRPPARAGAPGANSSAAQSILKADYREDLSLDEALRLAVKVLSKTMDATLLSADKLELASVSRKPSGEVAYHVYTPAELEPITAAVNAAAAAEEQAKAAEAAAAKKQ